MGCSVARGRSESGCVPRRAVFEERGVVGCSTGWDLRIDQKGRLGPRPGGTQGHI